MNWVLLTGLISFVLGLITGIRGLKSMRSKVHEQAEITWTQPPLSPWRYETLNMIVLTIHSLALICFAGLIAWSLTHHPSFKLPTETPPFLLYVAAYFILFYTTYVVGVTVAFHFAQPWIRPISYGISNDGLWYGGSRVDWKSYSHYELGPEHGLISLYSGYSPALPSWVLQPPSESVAGILGLIQKNLPSATAAEAMSWQRSPLALISTMLLLVIVTLLPAVWGWLRNTSWLWIYAFCAFFLVQWLGVKLITRFDGR
jgi:hypothetical protein